MRHSKSTKAIALLMSMTMITSVFVGNTLSRYVTSVSSTDSARVAIWGINGEDTTMELFNTSYDLAGKTIAKSNVDGEKIIAPGTGGQSAFSIINYENDEIPPEVAYEVKISLDDSEVDPKIVNNSSIQWKLDDGSWGSFDALKTSLLSLVGDPSGVKVYAPGTFANAFKGDVEHKIYWQWALDGNNEVDTQMGNDALTSDIGVKISVSVTAQQIDDLVTNANMLEGANQVVNLQDMQTLSFRSASDITNFQRVEVNGQPLTEGTDYTKTSGSTIITLTETYLAKLTADRYVINIISSDMTASTVFEVIDEEVEVESNPLIHSGIIPEGGTYYVGLDNYGCTEDYYDATEILEVGDEFPVPQTGDRYVYGDYEYAYNLSVDGDYYEKEELNGWNVYYIGESQYPEQFLFNIAGKDVVSMDYAFGRSGYNGILSVPVIPETVKYIDHVFYGIDYRFNGTIEINSVELISYNDLFEGIGEEFIGFVYLTGTCPQLSNISNRYSHVVLVSDKSSIIVKNNTGNSELEEIKLEFYNGEPFYVQDVLDLNNIDYEYVAKEVDENVYEYYIVINNYKLVYSRSEGESNKLIYSETMFNENYIYKLVD